METLLTDALEMEVIVFPLQHSMLQISGCVPQLPVPEMVRRMKPQVIN